MVMLRRRAMMGSNVKEDKVYLIKDGTYTELLSAFTSNTGRNFNYNKSSKCLGLTYGRPFGQSTPFPSLTLTSNTIPVSKKKLILDGVITHQGSGGGYGSVKIVGASTEFRFDTSTSRELKEIDLSSNITNNIQIIFSFYDDVISPSIPSLNTVTIYNLYFSN